MIIKFMIHFYPHELKILLKMNHIVKTKPRLRKEIDESSPLILTQETMNRDDMTKFCFCLPSTASHLSFLRMMWLFLFTFWFLPLGFLPRRPSFHLTVNHLQVVSSD